MDWSPACAVLATRCVCRAAAKTLKKWFIDRKVPAAQRGLVPVFADDSGVLAV